MKKNAPHTAHDPQSGRVPPQATEVEQAILGAMLLDDEAAGSAVQLLAADDFYKTAHQLIFTQLAALYDKDQPLDLLTIESRLKDQGQLEAVGGSGYLADLTRSTSSAANIEYHAQIVKEKALKRQAIIDATETIKAAYDPASDPYDMLDEAASRIDSLTLGHSQRHAVLLGDALPEVLDEIGLAMNNPGNITGVPSGLDIDDYTAGWQRGDFIVIAARPSMGKTALGLTVAQNTALYPREEMRTNVGIFSLEMGVNSLTKRFLCMASGVNQQHVRNGKISKKDYENLCTKTAQTLNSAGIYIDDTPGINVRTLRSKCRRMVRKNGVGLIIADYLQLMSGSGSNINNREQEIAHISRGLKSIAKELNVPVIALSQLSRAVELRANKRPQLSDLRESGAIEQDADVVMFIYRPDYYGDAIDDKNNMPTEGKAEIIIGKQRNGPTGSVWLNFYKEQAIFKNPATNYETQEKSPF